MLDRVLVIADSVLKSLTETARAGRPSPLPSTPATPLDTAERRISGALMRVNHVGEVCAQALYSAQALATTNPALRRQYAAAAREETDHLVWTRQRLRDLDARPSLLNPLWFAGAFGIGLLAGRAGDAVSLGFVVETERQVEQHLAGHLDRLPTNDLVSRAIVDRMKADEAGHAAQAEAAGARPLPLPVRWAMRLAAKVMTSTAYRL